MNVDPESFAAGFAVASALFFLSEFLISNRVRLMRKAAALGERWVAKPAWHPGHLLVRSYLAVDSFGYVAMRFIFRPRSTLRLFRTVRRLPPYRQSEELTDAVIEAVRLHGVLHGVETDNDPVKTAYFQVVRRGTGGGFTYDTSNVALRYQSGAHRHVTLGITESWKPEPALAAARERVKAALEPYVPIAQVRVIGVRLSGPRL